MDASELQKMFSSFNELADKEHENITKLSNFLQQQGEQHQQFLDMLTTSKMSPSDWIPYLLLFLTQQSHNQTSLNFMQQELNQNHTFLRIAAFAEAMASSRPTPPPKSIEFLSDDNSEDEEEDNLPGTDPHDLRQQMQQMSRKRKRSPSLDRVAQNNSLDEDLKTDHCKGFVELNVGGRIFCTLKETLCRKNNYFAGLFRSLGKGMTTSRDKQGRIYVDRDADLFKIILSYLRTGIIELPNQKIRARLVREFDFYSFTMPEQLQHGPHVLNLHSYRPDEKSNWSNYKVLILPDDRWVEKFIQQHRLQGFEIAKPGTDIRLIELRDKLVSLGWKETFRKEGEIDIDYLSMTRTVY